MVTWRQNKAASCKKKKKRKLIRTDQCVEVYSITKRIAVISLIVYNSWFQLDVNISPVDTSLVDLRC